MIKEVKYRLISNVNTKNTKKSSRITDPTFGSVIKYIRLVYFCASEIEILEIHIDSLLAHLYLVFNFWLNSYK